MFLKRHTRRSVFGACLTLLLSWASPLLACADDMSHVFDDQETSQHLHSTSEMFSHGHAEADKLTPEELCEALCDQAYSPLPALTSDASKSEHDLIVKSAVSITLEVTLREVFERGRLPDFRSPNRRPIYLTTERLRL